MKPDDNDVVELVAALDEVGRNNSLGAGGLRFFCRQAARMMKDLRPDLAFDPVSVPNMESDDERVLQRRI